MRGHWYIGMTKQGERVEFAVPAVVTTINAIALATRALPDWQHQHGDITWRATYAQRHLPADSQPTYTG